MDRPCRIFKIDSAGIHNFVKNAVDDDFPC
jgi:hypothetical protein